ncbi:unnamed protein product, partial [Musa textilis]
MERGQKCEVLKALEALKKASKEIEANPVGAAENAGGGCDSPPMKALLRLQSGSRDLLSGDPQLATLSDLLYRLRCLVSSFSSSSCRDGGSECGRGGKGGIFGSIRWRRSSHSHEISRVAGSIGAEIQSWIDRESADCLVSVLRSFSPSVARDAEVEEGEALVRALESRVSQGFDRGLQDVLLRSGAFAAVESALADAAAPERVRECAAAAVLALVRFNNAVFVGPVLMGPTLSALVSMSSASASAAALRSLNGLIRAIRSPLVDELQAQGHIPRLVGLLGITCRRRGAGAGAGLGSGDRLLRPEGGHRRDAHGGADQAADGATEIRPGRRPHRDKRRRWRRGTGGLAAARAWRGGRGAAIPGCAAFRELRGAVGGAGGGRGGTAAAGEAGDKEGGGGKGEGGRRHGGGGGHRAGRGAVGVHHL